VCLDIVFEKKINMQSKSLEVGWDVILYIPGELKECNCPVCNEIMDIERNWKGYTSYASVMGKIKSVKDKFTCPNAQKLWHQQAKAIKKLIEKTPSKWIETGLELELDKILKEQKATKEHWSK